MIYIFLSYIVIWILETVCTSRAKLKLASKKKKALRIVTNECSDVMVRMKVLTIYKLNICQVSNFMFMIIYGDSSPIFN